MQALIFSVLGLILTVITASQVSPSIINYIQGKKAESLIYKEQAIFDAINRYTAIQGTLPTSKDDLVNGGYISSSILDDNGWGEPITFTIDSATGLIKIDTNIPNEVAKTAYLNSSKNYFKPTIDTDGSVLSSFVIPQDILKGGLTGIASGSYIGSSAPSSGNYKFWYDTSTGNAVLKISDGSNWVNIPTSGSGLPQVSSTNTVTDIASLPTSGVNEGDIRYVYNTSTGAVQTYVYYSTGWQSYLGGTTYSTTTVALDDGTNSRFWSNGSYARNCYDYKYPIDSYHLYRGDIGSGTYTIDPDGPSGSISPFQAYCDMSTDDGGWFVSPASVKSNLQAYYRFKSDATDYTGNGHNGTLNGSMVINNGAIFDGSNDYVSIGTMGNYANWTISVWFQDNGTGSYGHYWEANGQIAFYYKYEAAADRQYLGTSGTNRITGTSSTVLTGVRYLLTVTYDGSTLKLYRNGVLDTTASGSSYTLPSTTYTIGGWPGNEYTKGTMWNTRVYDKALSAAEVKEIYDGDRLAE